MEYISVENANKIVMEKFANAEFILHNQFPLHNIVMPYIEWENLGRNTAGRAIYSRNVIQLNTVYLHSVNYMDFLNETPLHELAHIMGNQIYHERGHKRYWRIICYFLGLDGNRCHDFEIPDDGCCRQRRHVTTYTVHCACSSHTISSIRYNRIKRGEQNYICNTCHCRIEI